jgi:hypothetical protein
MSDQQTIKEILEYCRPYIKQMWAAKIVSILLKCDFRDAEIAMSNYELKELKNEF